MNIEQSNIWFFVKELLHEQDCVIVPGFGGFVCNAEYSKIDQVTHVINPPSKHIIFNQNLKTNDGLLANRISEKLRITYADAIVIIEENVIKTIAILHEKKLLVVDYFGSFRLNAEANFVFLPDRQNNFLYSSYGLIPLTAEPVTGRTIKSGKARIFKDRKQVRPAKNSKRRRNTIRVLASTFVLLLAVNFYVFVKDPQLKITGASMNISSWFDSLFHSQIISEIKVAPSKPLPIDKEEIFIFSSPKEVLTASVNSDSINSINQKAENNLNKNEKVYDLLAFAEHISAAKENTSVAGIMEIVESPAPETSVVEEKVENVVPVFLQTSKNNSTNISTDSSFYIIGGVFCKEKNAKMFFHQLEEKGFSPEIIVYEKVNCNRVSYAKFYSRKEALQQLKVIQSNSNPDAWLFAKHN